MNSKLRHTLLLPLMLVLTVFNVSAEELTLVIGDYAPYIDNKADNKGMLSEIVVKSFAEEGISANIAFKPWKRVEENDIPGGKLSYGWIHTSERAKKWLYSDPIYASADVFITRSDYEFSWQTLDDLKPHRIGVIRGYSQGDDFENFKSQLQVQVADSDVANLRKLLAKRIDLFPSDPVVAANTIRTNFNDKERGSFKIISEPQLSHSAMHLVCAKSYNKCQYYIDKFNAGQIKLDSSGQKQKIVSKATEL